MFSLLAKRKAWFFQRRKAVEHKTVGRQEQASRQKRSDVLWWRFTGSCVRHALSLSGAINYVPQPVFFMFGKVLRVDVHPYLFLRKLYSTIAKHQTKVTFSPRTAGQRRPHWLLSHVCVSDCLFVCLFFFSLKIMNKYLAVYILSTLLEKPNVVCWELLSLGLF